MYLVLITACFGDVDLAEHTCQLLQTHDIHPSFSPSLPHSLPPSLPPSVPPSLRPSLPPSLPPSLSPSLPQQVQYRGDETTGVLIVKCKRHIVTGTVIADVLLLTAYLFGVYLFRYGEPEHLSALMERVSTCTLYTCTCIRTCMYMNVQVHSTCTCR